MALWPHVPVKEAGRAALLCAGERRNRVAMNSGSCRPQKSPLTFPGGTSLAVVPWEAACSCRGIVNDVSTSWHFSRTRLYVLWERELPVRSPCSPPAPSLGPLLWNTRPQTVGACKSPGMLITAQVAEPHPSAAGSSGLEYGLNSCISNRFLGDAGSH